MNHHLTNTLIWIGYYLVLIIWLFLAVLLAIRVITKKWLQVKRTTKYLINSTVFFIAWGFILDLALFVRGPILVTNRASLQSLKDWIWEHQLKDVKFAAAAILIYFALNLFFYFKVENKRHKSDLILLPILHVGILAISIWLTGQDAYFGLLEEYQKQF